MSAQAFAQFSHSGPRHSHSPTTRAKHLPLKSAPMVPNSAQINILKNELQNAKSAPQPAVLPENPHKDTLPNLRAVSNFVSIVLMTASACLAATFVASLVPCQVVPSPVGVCTGKTDTLSNLLRGTGWFEGARLGVPTANYEVRIELKHCAKIYRKGGGLLPEKAMTTNVLLVREKSLFLTEVVEHDILCSRFDVV